MAKNYNKIDQMHNMMPSVYNTRRNPNWKAIIEAIAGADQDIAELITEVRKQFFVKTSSRPYIDRLAANHKIARPRLVGMDDQSFREYIPVLSYQPKQVKLIIDKLLDVFFFKESTTAFVTSQLGEPFNIKPGWELSFKIDEQNEDYIVFNSSDFTNISAARAKEVVASINRQAKHFYATAFYDSITKNTYIRLFTKTIGAKGSIRILGGRANAAFRFNGFINNAGNGNNTQWTVTKVGDTTTFFYTGGTSPNLENLQDGDIVTIDIPGNVGSFVIKKVDLINQSIEFTNLFSTPGVFTQTSSDDVKFIRPKKYSAYLNNRRAITWETKSGEITVEMPTSPPVVKRSLKGSIHLNGVFSNMTNRDSNNSLTVEDAYMFPESGQFILEPMEEIVSRWQTPLENTIVSKKRKNRTHFSDVKYSYSSRVELQTTGDIQEGVAQITNLASVTGLAVGQQVKMDGVPPYARVVSIFGTTANISVPATKTAIGSTVKFMGNKLYGITPNLPELASLNEHAVTSMVRASNIVTVTTSTPHQFKVGETVIIYGFSGGPGPWDGSYVILSTPTSNSFTYYQSGPNGSATTLANCRVERSGLSSSGSKVICLTSVSNSVSRITGPYIWDKGAPFVLASNKGTSQQLVQAGKIVRLLDVGQNDLPEEGGLIIFNYGKNNQEGPIRYMYKPTANTIAIDPSYTFKKTHSVGSTISLISTLGPHKISTSAKEYPAYVTDPAEARVILQDLIRSVKSAGIFVNFLIRYPEQLYATLDVYSSGVDPG
jgi:hypothetical protein